MRHYIISQKYVMSDSPLIFSYLHLHFLNYPGDEDVSVDPGGFRFVLGTNPHLYHSRCVWEWSLKQCDGTTDQPGVRSSRSGQQLSKPNSVRLPINVSNCKLCITCLFVCCCFMPYQQYFSYITVVIWYMRWEGESLSLHIYRLKGSLTSHTI